ncbi:esterase-like activity of phytase family protein [Stappia sp. ES.058]|uniref:esterase-like activity of phytase family protein n=1 Tax=Stappia sp. ES.058 TaxID=1881061 RepID=UPI00087C42BF|nr:esterase-like activity of phytase family protein [Stappia sp. ES.058]SDU30485.1 Esterase-like activity of phytase [Stappia sp. ES.058]
MKISGIGALCAALLASTAVSAEPVFNRIASFPVNTNLPADVAQTTETSAEIISATDDGQMLVYSDSPLGAVGMIDIADPVNPQPAGVVMLDGEPTAVVVAGGKVLAGVNTSESFVAPSGNLAVIDIASKTIETTCDVGGQPDSVAVSPSGGLVAVAIENERDEDLNDGVIPQMPAGNLVIFTLADGVPDCDSRITVDLTGLAEVAGSDPEPEFVDFNANDEIALTLQENNHIAVINGRDGTVLSHFPMRAVDLENVDVDEERALTFDGTLTGVPREPDAVQWLDTDRLVTANEGDYKGGSRGFTIFSKSGEVLYDSGLDFEYRVALAGHYPERRSGNKGAEPEGMEVKTFGDTNYIFLLSERGSVIGVYKDTGGAPEFSQLLPTALAPEGAVAIPERNLFAVSNEADLIEDGGVRSHVTLYSYGEGTPAYPMIVSRMDDAGRPIGFGALSGLAADPARPGMLYAVNDSFYAMQPTIFAIDATSTPATITDAIRVTRGGQPAQLLDLEGIAADGEGGFWLASEGRTDRMIPHGLYHVNAKGEIQTQVPFPAELLAVEKRFGAEGITMIGDTLWVAIQRSWGDDPKNTVKLVAYNTKTKEWGAVRYPTEPAETGWVGLSEITAHGDHVYIVERDNQIGAAAKIKKLYRVAQADLQAAALGGDLPLVAKEEVHDFIPDLTSTGGYVVDKIEGFAIDADGVGYAVTDNDGVDDSNGETLFFSIGKM